MRTLSKLAGIILVLALSAGAVWGSITGSISGTVSDPTGAVVPGATVVAVNTETGIETTTRANESGFYSFPALAAGHYEVRIRAGGFELYRQTGLVINVNSALRVDAALKVGGVSQEVSVSATAAHVETSNTQIGEVIGTTKMTALPLNGRSYTDLLALQPGVAPTSSGEGGGFAVSGNLDPGAISISGQREEANGFMVNGGSAEEKVYMVAGIVPNLDSIAEFRILTNTADAEYGYFSGGLVNVITKSGTNQFHGDAFEFVRNPNLDSRNFYSPIRGVLHQNQFGGTQGGPIWHDKVFFFADYQGTRMVQGVDTGLIPVPTIPERSGDFSDQAAALVQANSAVNGSNWANVLSQELGYPVTSGEPYFTYTPAGATQPVLCTNAAQGCVFPNAVIPQSVFTAPTKALMQYISPPNYGSNAFTTSAFKEPLRDDKGAIRIDANTRLGMLMGYYHIDDFDVTNPYGGASLPGFSAENNGRAQMMNLGLTKTLGSNSVNEVHLYYTRDVQFTSIPVGGTGVSIASQGFTGIHPNGPLQGVESVGFNNFSIGISAWPLYVTDNTYQVVDNFSKVIGTHILKFGGNFSYDIVNWNFPAAYDGGFGFNGSETGSDFADFLIGAPVSYYQGQTLVPNDRGRSYGPYFQDTWRVKPAFTLNLGLRWDVITPWWEAHNEQTDLVPGVQSKVFPGAPTGWVVPGDPGVPSTLAPTRYNNWGPRIGFAYSPNAQGGLLGKLTGGPGKTSIRAAFGVYYTSFEERMESQNSADAPFGLWWSSSYLPMFATPFIDRPTGHGYGQPFPVPLPANNVGPNNPDSSINWAQYEPISSSPTILIRNRVPYAEEYNFSIERQFGAATLVSASYVGTQGHRLISTVEANPGNPALCLSLSQPSEVMPGTPTCGPYGENTPYYPIGGGVVETTRPLGAAFASDDWMATLANSNYNAFQTTIRHTTGRLEFLFSYTFSKSLDNASGNGLGQGDIIDLAFPKVTKALSAFNSTNNFVVSYSYRLPFDKLGGPKRLTDGWVLSGITRFASGFPAYIFEGDDNSLLGTGGGGQGNSIDEPNRLPGSLNITNPRKADLNSLTNPYFNPALFTPEAIGQLGSSNRRFFAGPGINNWDLSLSKDLRLTESKSLQFRAEFFNAFNHAQFGSPQGNVDSGTFGFVTSANAPRIGQIAMKFIW